MSEERLVALVALARRCSFGIQRVQQDEFLLTFRDGSSDCNETFRGGRGACVAFLTGWWQARLRFEKESSPVATEGSPRTVRQVVYDGLRWVAEGIVADASVAEDLRAAVVEADGALRSPAAARLGVSARARIEAAIRDWDSWATRTEIFHARCVALRALLGLLDERAGKSAWA